MGGLPAIPQLRPFQNVDPLEQVGKALSIRDLQQRQQLNQGQMQLQQQQIQEGQLQLAQREALNKAYQGAVTMGPDGKPTFDQNKVFQSISASGQGSLIPGLTKTFMDLDEQKGKIQKAQDEHVQAAQEYMGHIGKIIQQSKYDPTIAGTLFARAAADGYGQQAQQVLGHLNQNPQDLKQIADEMVQGSSGQTKEALEAAQTGEAGAKTAEAEANTKKTNLELQWGGSPAMQEMRYRYVLGQMAGKKPVSPDDMAAAIAYEASQAKTTTSSDSLGVLTSNTNKPAGLAAFRKPSGQGGGANPNLKESVVDLIGQYKADPQLLGRMLYKHPEILGLLQQKYPDFDQTNYVAKNKAMVAFTSGPYAKQLNASNIALSHIGVLNDAIDALGNTDLRVWNRLANAAGVQTGKDSVTTFKTIVHKLAPELAQAYLPGGGGQSERESIEKDYDPSFSKQQLHSNLSMTAHLLVPNIETLANQYKQTVGRDDFKQRFIIPRAQAVLDKFGGGGQSAPAAQGAAPPISALKEGVHTTFKNGQTWTKQNGQAVQVK